MPCSENAPRARGAGAHCSGTVGRADGASVAGGEQGEQGGARQLAGFVTRQRVNQAIAEARENERKLALLFIDLDYFKNINDSLGHQIGDALLAQAASRLRTGSQHADPVARLGGDEFVLTLPDLGDAQEAALVARETLAQLSLPYVVNGHELHSTASIGISIYPDDGDDVDSLMRAADTAMYSAKEKGRNTYRFFTPSLNIAVQKRLSLETGLRQALQRNEFVLY